MTTSAPATTKKNVDTEVQYAESVIAWNVKMLLTAQNKSQSALAAFLGIQRPTMTNKMKGRIAWSVADLVKSADFLGTTAEALMDDSLMSQLKNGYTESAKPKYGVFAEKPGALVGVGSPRFLVSPFNPDAPIEGEISGAARGTLAGFVPSGVPSGSSSPSMPSKHDGIGVPARSQAHETLGTMTTIIMRTSEGDITINLFDDQTPVTVKNFLGLATGEKEWTDPFTGQPSDRAVLQRPDLPPHHQGLHDPGRLPAGQWHRWPRLRLRRRDRPRTHVRPAVSAGHGERRPASPAATARRMAPTAPSSSSPPCRPRGSTDITRSSARSPTTSPRPWSTSLRPCQPTVPTRRSNLPASCPSKW